MEKQKLIEEDPKMLKLIAERLIDLDLRFIHYGIWERYATTENDNFNAFAEFCLKEIEKYYKYKIITDKEYIEYKFYMGYNETLKKIIRLTVKIYLHLNKDENGSFYSVQITSNIKENHLIYLNIYVIDDEVYLKKLERWKVYGVQYGSKYRYRILATLKIFDTNTSQFLDVDYSFLDCWNEKENPFRYYYSGYLKYNGFHNFILDHEIGQYLRSLAIILDLDDTHYKIKNAVHSSELSDMSFSLPVFDTGNTYQLQNGYYLKYDWMYNGEFNRNRSDFRIYQFDLYNEENHYQFIYNRDVNLFEYVIDVNDNNNQDRYDDIIYKLNYVL